MNIKTVTTTDPATFDRKVNDFLNTGWHIVYIKAVPTGNYATMTAVLSDSDG